MLASRPASSNHLSLPLEEFTAAFQEFCSQNADMITALYADAQARLIVKFLCKTLELAIYFLKRFAIFMCCIPSTNRAVCRQRTAMPTSSMLRRCSLYPPIKWPNKFSSSHLLSFEDVNFWTFTFQLWGARMHTTSPILICFLRSCSDKIFSRFAFISPPFVWTFCIWNS